MGVFNHEMRIDPTQATELDWSQIDTVMLDMDGTLLDLHFDHYFWLQHMPNAYANQHQIDREEADAILLPLLRKHMGKLEFYCVDYWADTLELDIMNLKREVAAKIAYREGAENFLKRCNRHTQDVRLVTNAHRKVLNLKMERTNIANYFNSMLCSHELDAPKEDLVFWQRLQNSQGFDPQKTLFIDDSESVLHAAEEYGVRYLLSIKEPDSQRAREEASRFPMIEHFEVSV